MNFFFEKYNCEVKTLQLWFKQVTNMETSVSLLIPHPLSMRCFAECWRGRINFVLHDMLLLLSILKQTQSIHATEFMNRIP